MSFTRHHCRRAELTADHLVDLVCGNFFARGNRMAAGGSSYVAGKKGGLLSRVVLAGPRRERVKQSESAAVCLPTAKEKKISAPAGHFFLLEFPGCQFTAISNIVHLRGTVKTVVNVSFWQVSKKKHSVPGRQRGRRKENYSPACRVPA